MAADRKNGTPGLGRFKRCGHSGRASDKPECQLHEFDTTLWDCPNRYMYKNWLWSMCNLLYAVFREADPLSCGVPADMLEAIPQFKEYGLFREKEGKLQVDIPILTREEYALVNALCQKESDLLRESIAESLTVFQKTQYKTAPSHLGINAEFWTDKHALWHLEPAVYRTLYDHGIHLKDVDYNGVSAYGHFGKAHLPWEQ